MEKEIVHDNQEIVQRQNIAYMLGAVVMFMLLFVMVLGHWYRNGERAKRDKYREIGVQWDEEIEGELEAEDPEGEPKFNEGAYQQTEGADL
jgi:hypothetical protein